MSKVLKVFVGFDGEVEPVAYHAFCQSVIENSSVPVSFTPLALNTLKEYKENHTDGSNAFIYSRFLVPYLCDYEGIAIFCDGDMICNGDIAELAQYATKHQRKAVFVVKHDYKTKHPIKYLGNKNEDYPRKNWSSVIVFNNQHNKELTLDAVMNNDGKYLHRFSWLNDDQIGELPIEWNYLESEYENKDNIKLIHYTIGTPCFEGYEDTPNAYKWWDVYARMVYPISVNRFQEYWLDNLELKLWE
jgi:lipopolysaccharide biosynthesis glycosyltransferase